MAKARESNHTVARQRTGKGQHVGYLRVSTIDQNEIRQLDGLKLDLLRERQHEGIAIAKRAGKYSGGKPSLTMDRASELRRRGGTGMSNVALAREFGISRDTLYRYIRSKK